MLHRINIKEFEVSLVQSFPKPLSAKEEKECIEKCRSGDRGARDCLIERNLRLVAYIAKKYNMGDKDMDDLISIGTIGLIKGIDSFDETKNIRLATYAARCIEKPLQYIGCIIFKLKQIFHISTIFSSESHFLEIWPVPAWFSGVNKFVNSFFWQPGIQKFPHRAVTVCRGSIINKDINGIIFACFTKKDSCRVCITIYYIYSIS